jgi:hypothetical protein
MSQKALSNSLYRIKECPELMADACICDEQRNLVFLSVWGRETAVREFLARLTLGADKEGLDQFHLIGEQDLALPVWVGDVERLDKHMTREFRRTLFGSLIHVWLVDKRCAAPDQSNSSAFALLPRHAPDRRQRLWQLVQSTSPLPLLDHWRDTVLELLESRSMLSPLPFAWGAIEAHRLILDVPLLTIALGELIRADVLGISARECAPDDELRSVA